MEDNDRAIISRDPLPRFEDIPSDFKSTLIHVLNNEKNVIDVIDVIDFIVDVVVNIKNKYPTVTPGDIAVIFVDRENYIYNLIDELSVVINSRFGWDVNVSHKSKVSDESKFFISNVNNAKGLEFPFVICFALNLNRKPYFRNSLYTMMTRSFLESHLILGSDTNKELLRELEIGIDCIDANSHMNLRIPPLNEIEDQNAIIYCDEIPSLDDKVNDFCKDKNVTPRLKAKLIQRMTEIMKSIHIENEDEYFNSMMEIEYKRFKELKI